MRACPAGVCRPGLWMCISSVEACPLGGKQSQARTRSAPARHLVQPGRSHRSTSKGQRLPLNSHPRTTLRLRGSGARAPTPRAHAAQRAMCPMAPKRRASARAARELCPRLACRRPCRGRFWQDNQVTRRLGKSCAPHIPRKATPRNCPKVPKQLSKSCPGCRDWGEFGRYLTNFGPSLAQILHNLANCWPCSTNFGPNLWGQIWPEVWPEFGNLATLGQFRANAGRTWPNVGQTRPNLGSWSK